MVGVQCGITVPKDLGTVLPNGESSLPNTFTMKKAHKNLGILHLTFLGGMKLLPTDTVFLDTPAADSVVLKQAQVFVW